MRMVLGLPFLALASALTPAVAGVCHLVPLGIVRSVGKLGDVSVALGMADDAMHPTA